MTFSTVPFCLMFGSPRSLSSCPPACIKRVERRTIWANIISIFSVHRGFKLTRTVALAGMKSRHGSGKVGLITAFRRGRALLAFTSRCSDSSITVKTHPPVVSKSTVWCTILSEHRFSMRCAWEILTPEPHRHLHRSQSMHLLGPHWISIRLSSLQWIEVIHTQAHAGNGHCASHQWEHTVSKRYTTQMGNQHIHTIEYYLHTYFWPAISSESFTLRRVRFSTRIH